MPPEIRNAIYKLVFDAAISDTSPNRVKWQNAIELQPGIINTSAVTRADTLQLYYSIREPVLLVNGAQMARFESLINSASEKYFLNRLESISFAFNCGSTIRKVDDLPVHQLLMKIPCMPKKEDNKGSVEPSIFGASHVTRTVEVSTIREISNLAICTCRLYSHLQQAGSTKWKLAGEKRQKRVCH